MGAAAVKPEEARSRLRRVLRWALGLAIGLGAVGLIAIAALLLASDCEPPDDRDLIWVPEAIPDEENGFLRLLDVGRKGLPRKEAMEISTLLESDSLLDLAHCRELLANGKEHLEAFEACLSSPGFQDPSSIDGVFRPLAVASPLYDMTWRAALRARVLFQEGREGEAMEEALKLVRLGHRAEGSQGYFVGQYFARNVKEHGCSEIRRILKHCRLEGGTLIDSATRLSGYVEDVKGYIESRRVGYTSTAVTLDRIAAGDESMAGMGLTRLPAWLHPFLMKKNRTKTQLAVNCRRDICNVTRVYARMELVEESGRWDFLRPEALTNYLGEQLAIPRSSLLKSHCASKASTQATRLLLALKAYQMDHGRLPATLDELPPRYIAAVPADPFDGRPMRYSAERRVVWSIGADLVDSGGNRRPEDRDEPSFPIEWR